MKHRQQEKGIAHLAVVLFVATVIATTFAGWYVWEKGRNKENNKKSGLSQTEDGQNAQKEQAQKDETADWVSVLTQGGTFSMKVPDGWKITKYPDDFLGAVDPAYKPGTSALIESSTTEYVGHSLRFRASVTLLDDAGLGPQWASPQPGLEESVQDFSIDSLNGQRYKGIFSQDLHQTLYEYVFGLGNGRKLDILYTVSDGAGEKDDVITVEKAIKTIKINSS